MSKTIHRGFILSAVLLTIIILSTSAIYNPASVPIGTIDTGSEVVYPIISESLSPYGDLRNHTVKINCDLTNKRELAAIVKITDLKLDMDKADVISSVFNYDSVDRIENNPIKGKCLVDDNKRLRFYEMNHIFYMVLGEKPVVESYDEDTLIESSNKALEEIKSTLNLRSDLKTTLNGVYPYWTSTVDDEKPIIRAMGVSYDLSVDDVRILGPSGDLWFAYADDKIVRAEVHLPSVHIDGYQAISVSPEEAVNKFVQGKVVSAALGFDVMANPIPDEREVVIDSVELVYYIDFLGKEQATHAPLLYLIKGRQIDAKLTDPDAQSSFSAFVMATN